VPHTLLLADDSPTIHRVIELTFADEDIAVVAVDDGDKAIASLDRVPPDIVLADIGMPGRSGYEVARHVKETPELAHIPVLLLTGAFEPVDPAVIAAMRCDGVLTKPFEPGAVVRRVKELLDLPHAGGAPPSVGQTVPSVPVVPAIPSPAPSLPEAVARFAVEEPVPAPTPILAAAPVAPMILRDPSPVPMTPQVPITPSAPAVPLVPRDAPPVSMPPRVEKIEGVVPPPEADVESYFEELDHAFATLFGPDREPLPALDQFVKEPVPPGGRDKVAMPPAASATSLLDAFSALLAAERTATSPQAARLPPAPAPATPSGEVADRAVRQLLGELPEGALRRIVEDVVSATAERLIREEIERIKRNIK
jgi:CheY-like chemotaxis protein